VADVDDRWHRTDKATGEKIRTARYGVGKRWVARWRDPDTGAQTSKACRTKAEADQYVAGIATSIGKGDYIDPNAGRVTLRTYAEQWLASQTFDPTTRESVETRLRLHILPTLGGRELRTLRPSVIKSWTHGLSQRLSPNTVRTTFSWLSAILSAAVEDQVIARNPCKATAAKPPAQARRKIVPWTAETVAAVRAALPPELRPIVDLGAGCGLRAGEIAGLAVEDIDFLRGVVHVRRQLKMVRNRMVYGPPKGGKERDVPLPESIKLRLAEHLRTVAPAAPVTLPGESSPDGKPVTATLLLHRDGKVQGRTRVNAIWLQAVRRVGVPAGAGTGQHQLRHYYASALLHAGCSVQAVAEYLGHHSAAFTLNVYAHLMPGSDDRARSAVDAVFASDGSAPNVRQSHR
jgi:integrase